MTLPARSSLAVEGEATIHLGAGGHRRCWGTFDRATVHFAASCCGRRRPRADDGHARPGSLPGSVKLTLAYSVYTVSFELKLPRYRGSTGGPDRSGPLEGLLLGLLVVLGAAAAPTAVPAALTTSGATAAPTSD
jgi:hypothetical protein